MCALIGLAIPLFDHMYLQCIFKKWHVPLYFWGSGQGGPRGEMEKTKCDIM